MPDRHIPCPVCREPLRVDVHVDVSLSWGNALKLRLAGPEARLALLDELQLRLTELALNRTHPENL